MVQEQNSIKRGTLKGPAHTTVPMGIYLYLLFLLKGSMYTLCTLLFNLVIYIFLENVSVLFF